jgi:hypothetical protein
MPSGAIPVTIIKTDDDYTIVFEHSSKACFVANDMASLAPECPPGTSFLGHAFVDRESGKEWKVKILVFDIQSHENVNFAQTAKR